MNRQGLTLVQRLRAMASGGWSHLPHAKTAGEAADEIEQLRHDLAIAHNTAALQRAVVEAAYQDKLAAERARDLAVAHDQQPYPTAEAYERVCAALTKAERERDAAVAQVEGHRAALAVAKPAAVALRRAHDEAKALLAAVAESGVEWSTPSYVLVQIDRATWSAITGAPTPAPAPAVSGFDFPPEVPRG